MFRKRNYRRSAFDEEVLALEHGLFQLQLTMVKWASETPLMEDDLRTAVFLFNSGRLYVNG